MAEATFRSGDPQIVDYTPTGGDVTGGSVVLLGNTTGVACGVLHKDVANNVLGDVAVGGGLYDVINLDNAANYAKVWWDDTANKVTTTSTNNAQFGFVVSGGGGGANTVCLALHWPLV